MLSSDKRFADEVEAIRITIKARPFARITLAEAARGLNLSTARFHQIFSELQGENFGAYVRRSRLEFALSLMRCNLDWSLTQVAIEAGFSESSDFTRTFKRAYGIAPKNWDRIRPLNLAISTPTEQQHSFNQSPSNWSARVVIEQQPVLNLVLLKIPDASKDGALEDGFNRLEKYVKASSQFKPERRFFGVTFDSVLDTPADKIVFELGYPVDSDCPISLPFIRRTLPQCLTASVGCEGGPKEFMQSWDYLLRQFLPQGKWQRANLPSVEKYLQDPRKRGMKHWTMRCIVPIENKGVTNE